MSRNKLGYSLFRKERLGRSADRKALGERELLTFEAILSRYQRCIELNGKKVLDLGCGDQYIRPACELRGMTYLGLDIEDCDLERDRLPVSDSTVDFAVSLALLEHLFDPGHFFAEVQRVLRPGGVLWLSTPDIQATGAKFWNDPTHVHPYTRASLRTSLQMNGFEDVLVTPNYRCKPRTLYRDTGFNFFRARHLMPFAGTSTLPVPSALKGGCTGLFALGMKS